MCVNQTNTAFEQASAFLATLTPEENVTNEAQHLRDLLAKASEALPAFNAAMAAIAPAVAAIEAAREARAAEAARVLADRAAMLAERE